MLYATTTTFLERDFSFCIAVTSSPIETVFQINISWL